MDRSQIFGEIYRTRAWAHTPEMTLSGKGSDPRVAAPYVEFVMATLDSRHIRSVLDIGHGDWSMWPSNAFSDIQYLGIDVAEGLSSAVSSRFKNSCRSFRHYDAVAQDLPKADAVPCKDVLQHLNNDDAKVVLQKLKAFSTIVVCHDVADIPRSLMDIFRVALTSKNWKRTAASLLRGEHPIEWLRQWENSDIATGAHRALDLERAPWSLEDLGFKCLEKFDFPADPDAWTGTVKRVWLFEPLSMCA